MSSELDQDNDILPDGSEQEPVSTRRKEDTELLMDVVSHVEVLAEFHRDSLTREELAERLDVSRSTSYRYTNRLAEMDLIVESDDDISLTHLGEAIAEEVTMFERTVRRTLDEDGADHDVLLELLRHARGLEALTRRPLDRRELEDRLQVSNTTAYRMTRTLEDIDLIEKDKGRYELTPTGTDVHQAVSQFETNVHTAVRLGPVLRALRESGPSVDLGAFAQATITTTHGLTHSPQNRFLDLGRESNSLRGLSLETIVRSCLRDFQPSLRAGMDSEFIMKPEIAGEILKEYPKEAIEECQRDNVSVYLHDDLWYSLAIFDHRIGVGVIDPETGVCRAFVDTDSTAARTWAEDVYESYKGDAKYVPQLDPFTLRQIEEELRTGTAPGVDQR